MARQRDDDSDEDDDRPQRRRRNPDDDDDDYDVRRRRREPDDIGDNAGIRLLMPVGRSGWAIAAGYLGLFSVLCLPAPLALFTGIMAIIDMKRNPKKHGMGRAIFGVIMGAIGTVLLIFGAIGALINPR